MQYHLLFVSTNVGARVTDNVILHGTDISASATRGWGLEVQNGGQSAIVSGNIISECEGNFCTNITGDTSNANLTGNVIYDWDGPYAQTPGASLPSPGRDIESYNITQGGAGTMSSFAQRMRAQSRINWNDNYRIQNVVNYIQDGYFD